MPSPRVFYLGMICTNAYVKAICEDVFVGAASGKMSAAVLSMRLAGLNAVLVSLPFVGCGPRYQSARLCHEDGYPAFFLPVRRSPIMRKVQGIFSFAWFAIKRVRANDTIIFYNHGIEYFLALLILRLRGIAVFQDIEDVPIKADKGLRGIINRIGFGVMFKFSSARKITVSNQVGVTLLLDEYLPVPGIVSEVFVQRRVEKWLQLDAGAPLRIHYGGTLKGSTGLDLFCAAVEGLDALGHSFDRCIEFIVTGIGDLDRIRDLSLGLQSDRVYIKIYQGVSRVDYLELLDSSHASLSLRNPSSEISSTTFPSKVIEIASRGISLITTRVSDVGDIFKDSEAWFLLDYTPHALVGILIEMARNPAEVRVRADYGMAKVQSRFAPLVVGRALKEFLERSNEA